MDEKLRELVDALRDREMTSEEYQEQRVSFTYGNAPVDDQTSRESVREVVMGASHPKH